MKTIVINSLDLDNLMIMDVGPLCDAILSGIKPDWRKGIEHQGNWPTDAEWGVEYLCVDRQFDVRANRELNRKFFASKEALDEWFEEQKEWIKGTDYDFSIQGKVYMWDLGPNYVTSFHH